MSVGSEVNPMFFEKGEFFILEEGPAYEVIYADNEKAVCLKLQRNHQGDYWYTGTALAVSNKQMDYENTPWLKKVPYLSIVDKFMWEPIKISFTYNINSSFIDRDKQGNV